LNSIACSHTLQTSSHLKNYYFISSPLHLIIACNLAGQLSEHENIAIIISKNTAQAKHYSGVIDSVEGLFQASNILDDSGSESVNAPKSKFLARKKQFKTIKKLFSNAEDKNIYTGNDRRLEFQYAMHISKTSGAKTEGIYIDDGAVSYLGHKSINSFSHNVLDPLLKRIAYGSWWQHAKTTGSSAWISQAYLAFPELAYDLLKQKRIHKINSHGFRSEKVYEVSRKFLADNVADLEQIQNISVLFILPNEADFKNNEEIFRDAYQAMCNHFSAEEIAVKAHPRSKEDDIVASLFFGTLQIKKHIGMEMLMPQLKENVLIIGDQSTALLTAKWLRPELHILTLSKENTNPKLSELFKLLGIQSEPSITNSTYLPTNTA
jgi:hypothetical protein